ncbi:hypothetical protein GJ496_003477 [Pomphorhynchus laevis]|nr:hypothetical protein GJ496_003477 [Pomphorhynchus laevis]
MTHSSSLSLNDSNSAMLSAICTDDETPYKCKYCLNCFSYQHVLIQHQCLGHDHSSPSISTDRNMHSWAGQCPTNLITGGEDENIPNPCTSIYLCNKCSWTFECMKDRLSHLRRKHQLRDRICRMCFLNFEKWGNLAAHEFTHEFDVTQSIFVSDMPGTFRKL